MKRALLVLIAAALLSLGAANPLTQVYVDGETLDYDLVWLRISGGAARMTIAPADDARYRLTSVGKSSKSFARIYTVRDEIETFVSRDTFTTLHYRKLLKEGSNRKDETTVIDPETHIATRRGDEHTTVPPIVFDPLSLIYYMRGFPLTNGQVLHFTIIADGKLRDVEAHVVRTETLTTPAGKFDCLVVEPHMDAAGIFREDAKSQMTIWYSDDWRHLPVRIRSEAKIGAITATLRAVSSGYWSAEPGVSAQSK
ncbi:MAG TPA: DUF3108 domain-containing protein [Thermoanaerobaculia bacterium]|jgi:hypothetical protein